MFPVSLREHYLEQVLRDSLSRKFGTPNGSISTSYWERKIQELFYCSMFSDQSIDIYQEILFALRSNLSKLNAVEAELLCFFSDLFDDPASAKINKISGKCDDDLDLLV